MFLSILTPTPQALMQLNERTARFHLSLSVQQATMLARHEEEPCVRPAVWTFAAAFFARWRWPSRIPPYVPQSEWAQTLGELLDLKSAYIISSSGEENLLPAR